MTPTGQAPVVIGHRGAAGYRPEHTLASYELAARMGADFLEPDLVATADGHLVARHENEIGGTTDVAAHPEFAERRGTKTIDGLAITGWFTEDFTLSELRELRAVERIPDVRPRNTAFDGRYPVPTLAEIIALAAALSAELRREVGIYPETKHPRHFRDLGLALEPALHAALAYAGLNRADAPVFVQSFDPASLHAMRPLLAVPLIQLIDTGPVNTADLTAITGYADGIGPAKALITPRDAQGYSLPPTDLVTQAHQAGLAVHAYTFRNENRFLPAELRSSGEGNECGPGNAGALAEYRMFFQLGVDGVFSDNPDTAVAARGPGSGQTMRWST